MQELRDFWCDDRGSLSRRVANGAVLVTIGAVALTSLLDRATRDGGASVLALLRHGSAVQSASRGPRFGDVDPTPTGSIGRPVVLEPCTGRQK